MTNAPEFVELDTDAFYNDAIMAAAGIEASFYDEDNLARYLDDGVAVQGVDDANAELLQYPSEDGGVAMLLRFQQGVYDLLNAWPFLPVVLSAEVVPLKVAASPDGLQAFVTGRVGNAILTWFDDGFIENAPTYRAGDVAYAQFYGLATQAAPAEKSVFQIGPDDEDFDQLVDAGQPVNDEGLIEISISGAAIIMPRADIAPNAFEFRGPVMAVEPLTDWIAPDAAVVHVTVMRPFEDEEGNPVEDGFDLPILMRPDLVDGGHLPQPGEDLQGIVFLYGTGFDGDADTDETPEV